MKQSQLLRQSEAVSYLQEVEVDDDNEVVVGKNVAFDLSGFDGTLADRNVVGGRAGTAGTSDDVLGMPSIEGKQADSVAETYRNAVQGRSAKMSEILGRLQSIPTASRPENVTMLIGKILAIIKTFDDLHEKIDETYVEGRVEGFTAEMQGTLKQLYKKAKRAALESMSLEQRAKPVAPKRKAQPDAKLPKAEAKAKADSKAVPKRKTGKQAE